MFLKKIEMQGFKSFADKTKVEFDRGVTAVVGPNGSGKSNITESLRWALGESSAKSLRGGKMPDVIFAGTQNRKPLNYAQVTVVLDNSDRFINNSEDEIRVERHIYRNGDSEYLIDGKKVRLRDIHDLFMDTGLGRDSFSIISQGRVEAIFNSKPEERRAIFEEAAGVLKYKTRKKETESKLNQTQDNLDRLEDIIYELDNQLTPLKKQAETAKRFLVLEESRKNLHLNILIDDILSYQEKLQSADTELSHIKSELSAYYSQREKLESENQQLKEKRQKLNHQLTSTQNELLDITRLIADCERQIDLLQLESNQKEEKKTDATERLIQMQSDKIRLSEEAQLKQVVLESLAAELAQNKDNIKSTQEELAKFSTNPDQIIDNLRDDFVKLMEKEADVSNNLTAIQAEIEQQNQALASKSEELNKLLAERDELAKAEKDSKTRYEETIQKVQKLLKDYQELLISLSELKKDYQGKQNAMFSLLDQIKSKEARQSSLLAIQKNHSNFYAGVKAILKEAKQIGGIIGAVSEHLTFDTKYQVAMEIALGGSSQHIIVEDEQAAKRSIEFLKRNRSGRATFLPLTTIKSREVIGHQRDKIENSTGFLGFASNLVSYDNRLSQIFQNLLGTTAIFETTDQANQAARLVNFQVRMITLDGTEIRPGGAFAGGSNRQNNSLFIKPELDKLSEELTNLKDNLNQQEVQVEKARQAVIQNEETLNQLKEEGENSRLSEQEAKLRYDQINDRLNKVQQLCSVLQESTGQKNQNKLQERQADLETQLLTIGQEKTKVSENLNRIREDKDSITQKISELNERLAQLRLDEREKLSTQKFEQANINRIKTDINALAKEISNLETWLETDTNPDDLEKLPALTIQLEEARKRKTDNEKTVIRLRIELEDCDGNLDDIEEHLQKSSQKNESLIRQQAQLEADISHLKEKLYSFASNLNEDYQMSFDEAKQKAQPIEDLENARQELSILNRQIKSLGPINLESIEQHDMVSERLIFLNTQRDDLVHAKNLLLDTINDMNDEVKTRFRVTFEAIRESFKQTFTQMFGGGSADLILTEGDILSAGVEISVQPPGKKIQSLNLMSGGEKALSALALLFAIIRVKTIPFVILDEVEAALDEANVKRFGDYLNRFDKDSQFIVVTHRKGTMAAADSIYGVTMQESGVSKVISVKLTDAEQLVDK